MYQNYFSKNLDLKYLVKIIEKYDGKFGLYEEEDATNPLVTEANKYIEANQAPTGKLSKFLSSFQIL